MFAVSEDALGLVWNSTKLDKEQGVSMRFRHPLVLLLGGLLSASGLGCSAVTAVVSDTRPAARQGRGSADKYAAIARVYENQGRYDQAESMYRKALKQNPNNMEVRNSLQQLASRKTGRSFGNSLATEAVAKADTARNAMAETAVALNAKTPEVAANLKASAAAELTESSATVESVANAISAEAGTLSPVSFQETAAEGTSETSTTIEVATVKNTTEAANDTETPFLIKDAVQSAAPAEPLVSAEEVLAVVETPAEHSKLLLNGLKHGDSLETQCLAATLLGDCDRSDIEISEALMKANAAATDAYLRLAICDSRIQRAEHDAITSQCLISLLSEAPCEVQIQVCSSMHHFVGSDTEAACAASLESALKSASPELRAGAAVALGDFPHLTESAKAHLSDLKTSDPTALVRQAAEASLDRCNTLDGSELTEILVMPKQ